MTVNTVSDCPISEYSLLNFFTDFLSISVGIKYFSQRAFLKSTNKVISRQKQKASAVLCNVHLHSISKKKRNINQI